MFDQFIKNILSNKHSYNKLKYSLPGVKKGKPFDVRNVKILLNIIIPYFEKRKVKSIFFN